MKLGKLGILLAALVLSVLFATHSSAGERGASTIPEPPQCLTDAQCPMGQVCEPTDTSCSLQSRQCVSGCRVGSRSCGDGRTCLPANPCTTCPCPDRCEYIGIGPGDDDPPFLVVQGGNTGNPYDSAGQLHNAGLDAAAELLDQYGSDARSLTIALVQRMREFDCASSGEEPCYGRLPGLRVARSLAQPEQYQAEISAALSEVQRPYLASLMSTVRAVELGVEEQLAQLEQLEQEMQSALRDDEAAPLLQAASVARHSLVYWHGEASGDSRWNLDPTRVDDAAFDETVARIAAHDVVGGFVPYWPYYDPVQGAMASVWAIVMMILHLFF